MLRDFAKYISERVTAPVLDLPGWPLRELGTALGSLDVALAFDPLIDQPDEVEGLAYLRLAGPSGYRSRYG